MTGIPVHKPLRLWPGVVIVILQWLLRFVVPLVAPDAVIIGILGGFLGGVAIVLWWLFFSRAPWLERAGAILLMAAGLFGAYRIVDPSIATGAQRMLLPLLAVPVLSLALVAWAAATRHRPDGFRRVSLAVTILLTCAAFALIRTGGFTGDFRNDLHWRWTKTPEQRLLTQGASEVEPRPPAPESVSAPPKPPEVKAAHKRAALPPSTPPAEPPASWPGFRGPRRDGSIPGVKIKTDWTASPPVALWRRAVGPGWSSFAVRGGFVYTQEQRGPDEIVACYKLATGEPVWAHRDPARFWESNGGPGPRSTPTLANDRVYTLGATGLLNALNASDGSVVWSRNAASDGEAKLPDWGFSSSPLVAGDLVIAAVSGRLAAYDVRTGAPRWLGPSHGVSYSSPQLFTIGGVAQVILLNQSGATSVALDSGAVLWEHAWPGYPIVQPAQTAGGDILISVNESSGIRRLAVAHDSGRWSVAELWTSNGLKPYFNDFVIHRGHAFGFDGNILSCIDLTGGKRKWKGGRYGGGQLVLLPDQDLLLVMSEQGELALVEAVPDRFTELARFPAIEGKTWNHPVLVGDTLLTRNGEQMAAFRLTLDRP